MKKVIIEVAVNKDYQYLKPTSEVMILFMSKESVGKGRILDIQTNNYIIELELYSDIDLTNKEVVMAINETSTYLNDVRDYVSTHFHLRINRKYFSVL